MARKKKILIGVNGWGRGHSTRCDVVARQLIALGYDIKFLTDFQGYEYLKKRYETSQVLKVRSYRPITIGETINIPINVIAVLFFKFFILPRVVKKKMQFVKDWNPDVIITDAELVTGQFIKNLKLSSVYLSSVSFIQYCQLPFKLSFLQRCYVHLFDWVLSDCSNASLVVVSKMSKLQLKDTTKNNVHLLDVFLRPELEQNRWKPQGTHILVYLRGTYIKRILQELEIVGSQLKLKIVVYGTDESKNTEYVTFKTISDQRFMEDMLTADYVINTSGNQIIGEIAYLGVPALLLPEVGQFEQEFNSILACDFYENMTRGNLKTIKASEVVKKLSLLKGKPHPYLRNNAEKAVALIVDLVENTTTT